MSSVNIVIARAGDGRGQYVGKEVKVLDSWVHLLRISESIQWKTLHNFIVSIQIKSEEYSLYQANNREVN